MQSSPYESGKSQMSSKMQLTNCSRVVDKEKLCRIFFALVFPYARVKLVMESGKIGRCRLSNTCYMSFIHRGLKKCEKNKKTDIVWYTGFVTPVVGLYRGFYGFTGE